MIRLNWFTSSRMPRAARNARGASFAWRKITAATRRSAQSSSRAKATASGSCEQIGSLNSSWLRSAETARKTHGVATP